MNKFENFYMGIVVQNNDPLKKGRVKIYIPDIYPINDSSWDPRKLDSYFTFPMETSQDTSKPLTSDSLNSLKNILPWAEPALPIAAGNATGRYNAFTKTATTSDTNLWTADLTNKGSYKIVYGPRPTREFRKKPDSFSDAFSQQNGLVPPNPYSFEYNPPDYSNTARGMFSVPNVGAHLWVFFKEGNHMCPVYFAACAGGEDYNGIYEYDANGNKISVDYPSLYENESNPKSDAMPDAQTFRSKTVINSNKNTIELIDTDLREILRFTHYSGSFKEFNNLTTIELASKNDQKMVLGDQYETVNGNSGLFIGKNRDLFVVGDNVKQVGIKPDSKTLDVIEKIYKINSELHKYNRLFDLQRCNPKLHPTEVSQLQQQVALLTPGYSKCPVCGGKSYDTVADIIKNWTFYSWVQPGDRGVMEKEYLMLSMSLDTYKTLLETSLTPLTKTAGIVYGEKCSTCVKLDEATQQLNPTGYSPSTEAGSWVPEPFKKTDFYTLLLTNAQTALAPLMVALGKGDEIVNINQNKIETIGLKMNDLKPYRIDPEGKLRIKGITIAPGGVYNTFKEFPLVESVDTADLPGDYTLTACNKYKLLVGAKGIDIKTFGSITVIGSIVNFSGEQINITSNNEINIDGGSRLSLRASNISLHPYEHDPVVIDAPLHVARNITTAGGLYVEGEIGLQHITAPSEMQETLWMGGMGGNGWTSECNAATTDTETIPQIKTLYKTDCIPCASISLNEGIITSIPDESVPNHSHVIPPHTHMFFNIPLNLCYSKEQVRALMAQKGINSQVITVAANQVGGLETVTNISPEATNAINIFIAKCDEIVRDAFDNLKGQNLNITYSVNTDEINKNNSKIISDKSRGTGTLFGPMLYQMDYRINPPAGEEAKYVQNIYVTGYIFLRDSDSVNIIESVNVLNTSGGENEQTIMDYGVSLASIKDQILAMNG